MEVLSLLQSAPYVPFAVSIIVVAALFVFLILRLIHLKSQEEVYRNAMYKAQQELADERRKVTRIA